MKKKILLTGGTGFLGSHLARSFLEQGHSVSILTRPTSSFRRLQDVKNKINFISSIGDLSENYNCFLPLATCYGRNNESTEEIWSTNKKFPLQILEKIVHPELKIILAGTSLPKDFNDYSESKWAFFEKIKHLNTVHFLLEHFYGPSDNSFIGHLLRCFEDNQPELDLTIGEQSRDFLYYRDAVEAFSLALNINEFPLGNIPVGSGEQHSIRDMVLTVKKFFPLCKTKLNWGKIPYRPNEVMQSKADLSLLKKIGWSPRFSLTAGLNDFLSTLPPT